MGLCSQITSVTTSTTNDNVAIRVAMLHAQTQQLYKLALKLIVTENNCNWPASHHGRTQRLTRTAKNQWSLHWVTNIIQGEQNIN